MTSISSDELAKGLRRVQALQQQGDFDAAVRQLQALLVAFPDAAQLHHAMAQLASRGNRNDLALHHLHRAVTLSPGEGSIQLAFGCLLAHEGRLQAALEPLRESVRLLPTHPDAFYFLGITLARLGQDAEALTTMHRAYALAPGAGRIRNALAEAEFRSGFPEDALPLWQAILEDAPDNLDARMKLVETFSRLGFHTRAHEACVEGLERSPDAADLWMTLAQVQEDQGNKVSAQASYERALSLRPGWAFPLAGVLGLLRGKAPDRFVEEATTKLRGLQTPDRDQALIGYELGKVLDARGDYAGAMESWDLANAARCRMVGEFDARALSERVEHMLALFGKEAFHAASGSQDMRPVFIVGMPRSGTTLTEQIIAAHPQAHGCGELPDIALIAKNLPSRKGGARHWPHIIDEIDPSTLEWAIARYLAAATRHAPAEAVRLIDKAPMNYYALGLIGMMFPRARIVWCRRDPRDVAVSIYGENFSLSERIANRMDSIAQCINLQNRLMKHWMDVLPNPILTLDYEALVADPETQARRLLEFIGLDWHPACLEFHASEREVQTPSRWQVRQPIHTRSIGRWKNYANAMGPLLDTLEPRPCQTPDNDVFAAGAESA